MPESESPLRYRVLLIDDDRIFCSLIEDYLTPQAFAVTVAYTGHDGLNALRNAHFDIILLDMFLPDMHGIAVLREIRQTSKVPVLILSAHNEETDRIVTLEMGADDYVPKSFSSRELLAHIRAVQRRYMQTENPDAEAGNILRIRGLELNNSTKEARLNGQMLELTITEFRILHQIASEPGKVFTREDLLASVTDRDFNKYDRSVDVHISSLRHKLGDDSRKPQYIKTLRGIGYIWVR